MANERQTSRSNEANQAAIDALDTRVGVVENTVDSSAANPTNWVTEIDAPALMVSDNSVGFNLSYSGWNRGIYVQTGPMTGYPNYIYIAPGWIESAERTFLFQTDASYSTIRFAPDNLQFDWSGGAFKDFFPGNNEQGFSLIDASRGGTQREFLFIVKALRKTNESANGELSVNIEPVKRGFGS